MNQQEAQALLGPRILDAAFDRAGRFHRRVRGAAAVLFIDQVVLTAFLAGENPVLDVYPMARCDKLTKVSSRDPSVTYNLLAGVLNKIWLAVRTLKPSQQGDALVGELSFRGCVVFRWLNFYVFISFSGGTEEEDVKISTSAAGKVLTAESI